MFAGSDVVARMDVAMRVAYNCVNSLDTSEEECLRTEEATSTQNACDAWKTYRRARITAPAFKKVCSSKMLRCWMLVLSLVRKYFAHNHCVAAVMYGGMNAMALR